MTAVRSAGSAARHAWWAASLAASLAGCPRSASVPLFVEVSGDPAPGEYAVWVTDGGGVVREASCPEGGSGMACEPRGVRVGSVSGRTTITVKARGFRFATVDVDPESLPSEGEARVARIDLESLAPFEVTDDYATGFGADGLEAFRSMAYRSDTELGPVLLVKFYLADVRSGRPRAYFQNTPRHPLHWAFAHDVLRVPLDQDAFFAATYRGEDRDAMAGTLALYETVTARSEALGASAPAPLAITFFPSDDLTPDQALAAHRWLEERLGFAPLRGGGPRRTFYLPAGSNQEEELEGGRRAFARAGAAWMRQAELWGTTTLQILNEGEAYGTLRRMSAAELAATVVSFTDVLLLTSLPNDLPIVGGTITELFQTPLAHVNLAAMARGTPNVAWLDASDDPRVRVLLGRLVHFLVRGGTITLEEATLDEAQAFWDAHRPEPVEPAADLSVTGFPAFADLRFADSLSVGTKAANLAELRALLRETAPDGFAVPFSWYDAFLRRTAVAPAACAAAAGDCVVEGRAAGVCATARAICEGAAGGSLRDYVGVLLGHSAFGADSVLREAALDGLRYLIRHGDPDPAFAAAFDARVVAFFGAEKVRLRSSTNAEDLRDFSGAGLYDSCSAFGAGATDRASEEIRKVWASVWNWSAFEERSWWGIDHASVYMGVAVHRAFGEEQANGVLVTQNLADRRVAGMYVNVQAGEVSVTNPEGGERPEIFSILPGDALGEIQVARLSWSSLSPGVPILTEAEVRALYDAASRVQARFARLYGEDPYAMALDLEFKFGAADRALSIKQVRPFAGF